MLSSRILRRAFPVASLAGFLALVVWADTIVVPVDFPTIQEAIDAAQNADCILVEPGIYMENIDFLGKAITLLSTDGPERTVIDGRNCEIFPPFPGPIGECSVVRFANGEGPDSVLQGFTITNGSGSICPDDFSPGFFFGACCGGGIYCESASPTLINDTISGNSVSCNFYPYLSVGGGMLSTGSPELVNCRFLDNSANGTKDDGLGGGMWGTGTLINCTFSSNRASGVVGRGGGMRALGGTLLNCTFSGNTAIGFGYFMEYGGQGGGLNMSDGTVVNSSFSGNRATGGSLDYPAIGGGMVGTGTLTNCTFSGNVATEGGAMSTRMGSATVVNSILWNDVPDELCGNFNVSYSNVQGGFPGPGNIDADPLFVDNNCMPSSSVFFLDDNSPSVDAGDPSSPLIAGTTRCDGAADQGIVDMGFHCPIRFIRGDCNANGVFSGLTDGLTALLANFAGFPTPPCLAACDADHDRVFDGFGDGLMILNAQFVAGFPPLDSPFPACGPDPNGVAALGCDRPPPCP